MSSSLVFLSLTLQGFDCTFTYVPFRHIESEQQPHKLKMQFLSLPVTYKQ